MALAVGTNSYISVSNCTDYFADRLEGAEWVASSNQAGALVSAFDLLQRQKWQGAKYDEATVPDWPRTGLVDQEGTEIVPASNTDWPQFILDAQCQLALALIIDPTLSTKSGTADNTKRLKAGSAEIEFFGTADSGVRFPPQVWELLGMYLQGSGNTWRNPFVSDVEATSSLNDYTTLRGL